MNMIYFIQGCQTKNIKIGHTIGSAEKRMADLQVGCSELLVLLGVMAGDRKREKELHRFFRSIRVRGEWFRPEVKLLTFIADPTKRCPEQILPYAELEPRILDLLEECLAWHEKAALLPRFCANSVWCGYDEFEGKSIVERMSDMVGWYCAGGTLKTSKAYDAVYDALYDALPDCRNCLCLDPRALQAMWG